MRNLVFRPLTLALGVVSFCSLAGPAAAKTFHFPNPSVVKSCPAVIDRIPMMRPCVVPKTGPSPREVVATFLRERRTGTHGPKIHSDAGGASEADIDRLIIAADGNDPNYEVRQGGLGSQLDSGSIADFQGALDGAETKELFPGALVQGDPKLIGAGKLDDLGIAPGGGSVTILGPQFTSGSNSAPVSSATRSLVNDAIERIVRQPYAADQFGNILCHAEAVHSVADAMWKIGGSFSYASMAKVTDTFSSADDTTKNHVELTCTQTYYDASFTPNPQSDGSTALSAYFAPNVTPALVAQTIAPGKPPLYVSDVKFGAEIFAMFDTSGDTSTLTNALNASFSNGVYSGSLSVDTDYEHSIDETSATVFAVGGRASGVKQTIAGGLGTSADLVSTFQTYLNTNLDIAASSTQAQEVAAPIGYGLSYLDNQEVVADADVYGPAQTVTAAVLQSASVSFHQDGDGKDHDSILDIALKDRDGNIVATYHMGDLGKHSASDFADNSDVGPFTFKFVNGHPSEESMDGGRFKISIQPNGNDTWHYTATLKLVYSDRTFVGSGKHTLSQDYPVQDDMITASPTTPGGPAGTGFFH